MFLNDPASHPDISPSMTPADSMKMFESTGLQIFQPLHMAKELMKIKITKTQNQISRQVTLSCIIKLIMPPVLTMHQLTDPRFIPVKDAIMGFGFI